MLQNQKNILDALPLIEDEFGPLEYKNSSLKSGTKCLDVRPMLPMQTDDGHDLSWVMSFTDKRMTVQSLVDGKPVELIEAELVKNVYLPTSRRLKGEPKAHCLLAARVGELFSESFFLQLPTKELN